MSIPANNFVITRLLEVNRLQVLARDADVQAAILAERRPRVARVSATFPRVGRHAPRSTESRISLSSASSFMVFWLLTQVLLRGLATRDDRLEEDRLLVFGAGRGDADEHYRQRWLTDFPDYIMPTHENAPFHRDSLLPQPDDELV
jgi:hypothetical protein